MHLSAVLQRSCKVYADSNLFIDLESNTSLTYNDAWSLTLNHAEWISQQLKDVVSITKYKEQQGKSLVVVVAFLAQNCSDLLFSVLGCIHTNYCNSCQQRRNSNVLPAMLNFRWSAKEIAQALSKKSTKNDEHYTIIIHDQGMEGKARDAVKIISLNENKHVALAIPLPLLSTNAIVLKTDSFQHEIIPQNFDKDETSFKDNFECTDAIILFTSGSTGGPKGVRLSHLALFTQSQAKLLPPCSYCDNTRMIATTVPFFHVGGLSSALALILAGGSLIFPPQSRQPPNSNQPRVFQPETILKTLIPSPLSSLTSLTSLTSSTTMSEKMNCNTLVLVPAMLFSLLKEISQFVTKNTASDLNDTDALFSHVKLLLIGGQGISPEQLQQTIAIFRQARVVQTFACTEAASSITFAQLHPKRSFEANTVKKGSSYHGDYVGIPPPHIQLAIFSNPKEKGSDLENKSFEVSIQQTKKQILPPYEIGLIASKGPHVMNGYWNRSTSLELNSQRNIDWFISNDLGYLDDHNRLFFVGRANDVIRTGGETVFATEVERIVRLHIDVEDCAVVGLPNERFGELVSVAIRLKKNNAEKKYCGDTTQSTSLLNTLRKHCSRFQLAGYKQPRKAFIIADDLPRNASGKILKLKVKEMLMNESRPGSSVKIIFATSKL